MSLITRSLHYIGKHYPNSKAVQLGAMDGINFDDTRGFFDMYKWETVLVEPVPEIFEQLKENLKDRENLIYENSAVGIKSGVLKMLTIPSKVIEDNKLPTGYKGMSAAYPLKNGFGSDYQRDIDVKNQYGVDIEVPCLTFEELLKKHNFNDVNILISDIEGYDFEVFKTIDLNKYDLKFIRLEYVNLTQEEKTQLKDKLEEAGYITEIEGQNIDAVKKEIEEDQIEKQNYTIVSGLWDIGRKERDFENFYLTQFSEFLEIDANMILFVPSSLESFVWERRSKKNTFVKIFELEDIKNLYAPHWDKTQEIRTSDKWLNITGEGGWLHESPQASLEYYNPIVQSKMFMLHDASIYNTFNTDYFFWLDAGITKTVAKSYLVENKVLDSLPKYSDPFLFLSYPYIGVDEIHGFDIEVMKGFARTEKIEYVNRGGLFGGRKEAISEINSIYYTVLHDSLSLGCMGTEESIFTIMSYNNPNLYNRYELDDNGLILKFAQAIIDDKVELKKPKNIFATERIVTDRDIEKYKTNLYILTFNFPEQLLYTIESMKKVPEWLEKPRLILLDNSTDVTARQDNKEIADEYNFEYIGLGGNKGICGGRQAAAEHFHKSDADFYFFFEDDMTSNPPELKNEFCRNGLKKYIPNLYNILHKIILKEDFDFLKLSFTEVYWDNNIQTAWYNVPQHIRTRDWPNYDKLPITGNDPNAPRTNFKHINSVDNVAYITGEITYTNWPMIVSKKGNKKMFIDTTWANPFEQTWMSHMYQLTKEGKLNPAVLLASPIWHERIKYYKPEERREN